MLARAILTSVLLAGCKADDPAEATLALSAGQERESWTQAPAPTEVALLGLQGATRSQLARGPWPADGLGLGTLGSGTSWAFRAEFRDASGALVMAGQTPALLADALSGHELLIHCGRVGAFSRPTAGLSTGWERPPAAALLGRYVLVAGAPLGGSATPSELYDLVAMAPLQGSGSLPRVPRSLAASEAGVVLLIDDKGATAVDYTSGGSADVAADLAGDASGGATLDDGSGGSFVVGATRTTGSATGTVLHLDSAGAVTRLSLNQPRLAAAAAWVAGVGLVVAGGQAEGAVEVLAPGATAFVSTGLVVAATEQATLAPVGASGLLLAGGLAPDQQPRPPVLLSLACAAGCAPAQTLPLAIEAQGGRGYGLAGGKALLIGEGAAGTVATLVTPGTDGPTASAVPLRRPRRGASSLKLDDGRVLVLGGTDAAGAPALDVEIFTPFE